MYTHTKKNLSSRKVSCFCSKHHYPLIIVFPLVSCLISATEYLLSFTTNSLSGSCLLYWNTVHLFIPVSGRCTFHGRWQTEQNEGGKGSARVFSLLWVSMWCCPHSQLKALVPSVTLLIKQGMLGGEFLTWHLPDNSFCPSPDRVE